VLYISFEAVSVCLVLPKSLHRARILESIAQSRVNGQRSRVAFSHQHPFASIQTSARPTLTGKRQLTHSHSEDAFAIPLKAVAGTREGLRQSLIIGVIASRALLVSLAIVAFHALYARRQSCYSQRRLRALCSGWAASFVRTFGGTKYGKSE